MASENTLHGKRGALDGPMERQRILSISGAGRRESAYRGMIGRDCHPVYVQSRETDPCQDSRYHPFDMRSPALPNERSTSSSISWNVLSFGLKEAMKTIQRFFSVIRFCTVLNISLMSLFALFR